MTMQKLKLISSNVNGLNLARKRRKVFHWLKKQNCNLLCMQEAHIKKTERKFLINKHLGEEFYSLSEKKKRGTITYVKKELNPRKIFSDDKGRYVAVEISLQSKKILILNIYAPNGAKTLFFQDLQKCMDRVIYEHLIIVGDFNGTVENELDRSCKTNQKARSSKLGRLPGCVREQHASSARAAQHGHSHGELPAAGPNPFWSGPNRTLFQRWFRAA